MVNVIKLPAPASQGADEHARADTQRKQRLFDWADAVLKRLGLDKALAAARSIEELRRVTFNAGSAEVALAIRDALHPAAGHRQEHFRGLKEGSLKQILKNRFTDLKRTREATFRRRKQPEWSDQLILDNEGKIIANLANVILILSEAPKWKGVLAYDEFNARVVIKGRPPPNWSEYVSERHVRHFWSCESCGHQFETSEYLRFETMSILPHPSPLLPERWGPGIVPKIVAA